MLSEQLLSVNRSPVPVSEYVSSFRERLHGAWDIAQKLLSATQFSGPYMVERKLSDTDYVIATPDRQKRKRVCHVNMLKCYLKRGDKTSSTTASVAPVAAVSMASYCPAEDGLTDKILVSSCGKLKNSVILRDLSNTLSYLTDCQRKELLQLKDKYPSLFADVPGRTSVLTHDIDVGDSLPIKQNAYRVNPKKRAIMKEEIEYTLRHDIAIPSQNPGLTQLFDSALTMNKITKADSFPLPRVKDCVDRVGSANFVSKLDLLKGYWQVPLTPRASEISVFVTPDHFMQYKVLVFGIRNAAATFQRLMQRVLVGVTNCEVYIDDGVVYSSSWEEHVKALEDVFSKLAAASLTLNAAKCEFGKAVVTYLGRQVGQGCVRPVAAKVEAILQFPTPSNKRELRQFLGMAGYYRGFFRNFSAVVSPLTDLLSSSRKFIWDSGCSLAFDAVKDLLCNAPVLSAPKFEKLFKLQVDASATRAGAVFLQEDEHDVDHPISYFSKKFTSYQKCYSTIEKEALALLLAL
ncbi:hypothetical protein M9458_051806 [Cirrhinus mrigala]|uniref:ribonuclease H n=1 Tax=Cirrhinus mrigala TaxID=683832 RepID=A0ABD0MS52_CIRMR